MRTALCTALAALLLALGGPLSAQAPDPNGTRLFFGPTGRTLQEGEGYAGLYELFFPFVAYGLTDWVTIAGGTPIAPGFIGEVFYLAPKVRLFSSQRAQVSGGVLAFFATEEVDATSVGILYSVGTFGTADHALTVGAGLPFVADRDESELADEPLLLLGGETRTGRRTKLITENYFIPGERSVVASGGVRIFGEQFSADLGLGAILGDEGTCCLPLLNVVYSWR